MLLVYSAVRTEHLNIIQFNVSTYRFSGGGGQVSSNECIKWFLLHFLSDSGFAGLEVACWPLVPKFVSSNPAEAVGFFRAKKNHQHADLRHAKDPWMLRGSRAFSGKIHRPFLAQVFPPFTTRVSGGDTWRCKQESLKTRVCTISLLLQCIREH